MPGEFVGNTAEDCPQSSGVGVDQAKPLGGGPFYVPTNDGKSAAAIGESAQSAQLLQQLVWQLQGEVNGLRALANDQAKRIEELDKRVGKYGDSIRFSTHTMKPLMSERLAKIIEPIPEPSIMDTLAAVCKRLKQLEESIRTTAVASADRDDKLDERVAALEEGDMPATLPITKSPG